MTNEVKIRVVLVTMLVLQLFSVLLDVKRAFLQGEFGRNEKKQFT